MCKHVLSPAGSHNVTPRDEAVQAQTADQAQSCDTTETRKIGTLVMERGAAPVVNEESDCRPQSVKRDITGNPAVSS